MELISRQSSPRRLNYTDGSAGQAVYDYVVVIFRKFANFTDDLIGNRGRGTGGRRGWPRKRTSVPLDLGEAEDGTSTLLATSTPVIPTPSLFQGLLAMRMIPTPASRVQSSETHGTCSQRKTPTQTTTGDDETPHPSQI
ncbi:hypothetical protein PIB30_069399 [Stylosanthes scabra]|uniref:Uncharacterized protein n=1 Tax=Stylosanthes scabra TaxID=79078 RepID=A0ABU6SP79_9FABA|nr:hypothetical protein [Stylosanthes scabra]